MFPPTTSVLEECRLALRGNPEQAATNLSWRHQSRRRSGKLRRRSAECSPMERSRRSKRLGHSRLVPVPTRRCEYLWTVEQFHPLPPRSPKEHSTPRSKRCNRERSRQRAFPRRSSELVPGLHQRSVRFERRHPQGLLRGVDRALEPVFVQSAHGPVRRPGHPLNRRESRSVAKPGLPCETARVRSESPEVPDSPSPLHVLPRAV